MFLVRRGGLPAHDDRNNGSEHGIHGGQHGIDGTDGINGTDAGTDDVRTGAPDPAVAPAAQAALGGGADTRSQIPPAAADLLAAGLEL